MAGPFLREDSKFNAARKAEDVLDHVLNETSTATAARRAEEVAVESELRKQRILAAESTRNKSRVLFVTADPATLDTNSALHQRFIDLQEVFDEVHVLLLVERGAAPAGTTRLAPKAWVYTVTSRFFLARPFAARVMARRELTFADGFRPDLVVALEPFEAALAAYLIVDAFDRPLQIHLTDDTFLTDKTFLTRDRRNRWRLRFLRFVLRRALSVRVSTDRLKTYVTKHFRQVEDCTLLPRYFNTKHLLSLADTPAEDKFSQFSFTMLYIGELGVESTLFRALDAARAILQTPSIGFVVIGDGPLQSQFRERAQILGIGKQVLFLGKLTDYLAYLRSADVLLVTDTTTESDDLVITAAALGVPLIMAHTSLREDLFDDGLHAGLVDNTDTLALHNKLRQFLNTNALRMQYANNAREIIRTRIEEDPSLYRIAYRDSIEQVLYHESEVVVPEPLNEPTTETPPVPQTAVIDGQEMRLPDQA